VTPNPHLVIEEIGRALLKEVGPHVGDAYAHSVLQRAVLLLQVIGGTLDGAAQALFSENAALRALFASARGLVRDESLRTQLDEASSGSADPAGDPTGDLSVSALEVANKELRTLLIALHAHVEDDPALAELERAILRELVASTERRAGPLDRF
jgi:hypothetical protein